MPPTGKKTTGGTKAARSKSAPAERQMSDVVRRARLEDAEWYVGQIGRDAVEPLLKTDGQFAVRASGKKGDYKFGLAVRADDRIFHVAIRWCPRNAHWTVLPGLDSKGFPSLSEMIAFYATNDLKIHGHVFRLQRSCEKPAWKLDRRNIAYSTRDKLGSGNFCVVYKGRWKHTDVAVKVCGDEEDGAQAAAARGMLLMEGQLMLEVRHVNVIQFFGMACEQPPVIVLLELCPGGSLISLLEKEKAAISTSERLKFAVEAAEGMVYLHHKGIIHRDLAARNCLISQYGAVKIADFGLSKVFRGEARAEDIGSQQLPVRWMAPESLHVRAVFSLKSDVWSFGVLLYEIFNNGVKPWPDWPDKKIATCIRHGRMPTFPPRTPANVVALVQWCCWVLKTEVRSTMLLVKDALRAIQAVHPYKLEELAVNRIPDVRAMAPAWIRATQQECEDIPREVRTAATTSPTSEKTPAEPSAAASSRRSRSASRRSGSRTRSDRRSRTETGHFEEIPQPTASNEPPHTSRKSRKSAHSGKSVAQPAKPPQGNEK